MDQQVYVPWSLSMTITAASYSIIALDGTCKMHE